jgi:predicted nucleotidyltransferase
MTTKQVLEHQPAIEAACRRREALRLYLFGSAARGSFDPLSSDLDFLVEFAPGKPTEIADRYLGLLEDLESLFGRSVDLVIESSVRNPYFRQSLEATRSQLFAA